MVAVRSGGAAAWLVAVGLGVASCGGATRQGDGDGSGAAGGTNAGGTNTGGDSSGGNSGHLYAREFDQSCVTVADCTAVHEGEQCECRECINAGIRGDEDSRWRQAQYALMCRQFGCGPTDCPTRVLGCVDSRCAVLDPPIVVASDYDQRCRVDSDCYRVFEGPMCTNCSCVPGAVSRVGYAAWRRQFEELLCIGTIPGCECGELFIVCVPRPDGDGGRCEAHRAP